MNTHEGPQQKRRNKQSHQAILDATLLLLGEKGYFNLSIEGIAASAGVGKQTIYRWWPSKAALVIEAYAEKLNQRTPLPDTGTVREDLVALLTTAFDGIRKNPSACALTGVMAEAQTNEAIAEQFYSGFIQGRRERAMTIMQRGITRGEIDPATDLDAAADLIFGPMWYRLLLRHAPLDADFARTQVDQLLIGISK